MLELSSRLPGILFTYIDSLSLSNTGICFLYAFLSRLPFVRCPLGDNWFIKFCYYDNMLYFLCVTVAFGYLIDTCLCSIYFNSILYAYFCCKSVGVSNYRSLNVLFIPLSIQLNNKPLNDYNGAN